MNLHYWAESEARTLLAQYAPEWKFKWGRGKRQLGCCHYRTREISLSTYYVSVSDKSMISDTLRHEVAHILAGPGAGHGPIWKKYCLLVGAKPLRCSKQVEGMPAKYLGKCPCCNNIHKAHRMLKSMTRRFCAMPGCSAYRQKQPILWRVVY
jgi:predicted SprT family Zn-dependent metalloprotease